MTNAFQIKTFEKSFVVLADTPEDKKSWMSDIQSCIEKERDKALESGDIAVTIDLQTSSSDFELAPVWVGDDAVKSCMVCTKKFSLMKRRHHCRSCGKLVCSKCSPEKMFLPNIRLDKRVRVCIECSKKILAKRKPSVVAIFPPSKQEVNSRHNSDSK